MRAWRNCSSLPADATSERLVDARVLLVQLVDTLRVGRGRGSRCRYRSASARAASPAAGPAWRRGRPWRTGRGGSGTLTLISTSLSFSAQFAQMAFSSARSAFSAIEAGRFGQGRQQESAEGEECQVLHAVLRFAWLLANLRRPRRRWSSSGSARRLGGPLRRGQCERIRAFCSGMTVRSRGASARSASLGFGAVGEQAFQGAQQRLFLRRFGDLAAAFHGFRGWPP